MSALEVVQGALVVMQGRVANRLNGAQVPQLTLWAEVRQGGGAWTHLPFAPRLQGGGWYAVAARMTEVAARLRLGVATQLRLTGAAPGFRQGQMTLGLTAAQFALRSTPQQIKGVTVAVRSLAAAPFRIDLALDPMPVMLAGLVIAGHDPRSPVAGASVAIAGGPTTLTDAQGRFRIDAPPLALAWDLTAAKGPDSAALLHVADFATPVNFVTLSL